jgi:hypothetical protein
MQKNSCASCGHCITQERNAYGHDPMYAYTQIVCTFFPKWVDTWDSHYCGQWIEREKDAK